MKVRVLHSILCGVGEMVNATRYPLAETKVEDQVVASKLNLVRLAIKSEPGE
jgi:hypothetical protein